VSPGYQRQQPVKRPELGPWGAIDAILEEDKRRPAINYFPVPKDEAPKASSGKVVNLMDALRKSMESDPKGTTKAPKRQSA